MHSKVLAIASALVALIRGGELRAVGQLGKCGRDTVPHEVGLRNAVQQEHGRPVAAAASMDGRRGNSYVEFLESLVHGSAQRCIAG